ncbi:hypothetical protein TRVA0_028S01046 [Trichomonascus vanleenenianus]|uniref:SUR7/PalI family protein n=1 Tax=Trichomonascus vanleenenianus TaxID=2268995 RepID=UPI003ECB035F
MIKAEIKSVASVLQSVASSSDLSSLLNELDKLKGQLTKRDDSIGNDALGVANSAINSFLGANASSTDNYLTIGISGYCVQLAGIRKCYNGPTPFYFDYVNIINTLTNNQIDIPEDIEKYQGTLETAGKAIWFLFVIGLVLVAVSLCTGVFTILTSCCSQVSFIARVPSFFTTLSSSLATLSLAGGTFVATGLYAIVKSKLNDVTGTLAMDVSLGTAGLALAWISFAAALVASICWSVGARASRRQIAYVPAQPYQHGY